MDKLKLIGLVCGTVLASTQVLAVALAQVPQTGQTPTAPITATLGMDGLPYTSSIPMGVPWAYVASGATTPATRFTVGSGATADCITDNLTGLMWPINANLFGTQTWNNALTMIEAMNTTSSATGYNLCGYTDWRLPNRSELFSLVNFAQTSQATWLNGQGFNGVQANSYLSSSSYAPINSDAWLISFQDGTSGSVANKATENEGVWPVRGGL